MPTASSDRITIDDIRTLPTITPKQACGVLDMDMDSVLKALRNGELPGFKIGRLWKIPVPKLLALLDGEVTVKAA
ncbi:MAG TPA: helix-turn-helix domain-containing protein [Actinocrinis sp.]|uniref:helix-turn-helix domain-containing protein n=1 Tax=Actinocrinis sp. TaxID=1920516 RepID=UPI002DDD28F2|nr:helix-turn-helix domain-containing protein [Actinocrinis sp.]HEV2344340.1 helix-turn-helix domain-containing protein [Actinocrinis sp.]